MHDTRLPRLVKPMCRDGTRPLWSVDPWQIVLPQEAEDPVPIPYCRFRTKREGQPILAQLLALPLDWHQDRRTWPDEWHGLLVAVVTQTRTYAELQAQEARGPVAPR